MFVLHPVIQSASEGSNKRRIDVSKLDMTGSLGDRCLNETCAKPERTDRKAQTETIFLDLKIITA